jgi:predicted AAA+ superfamily ATPase
VSKKHVFKEILQEFIQSSLPTVFPRDLDIPEDVPRIISLLGPRRAGKTYCLFQVIQQLQTRVDRTRLVYVNFEDDRVFPLQLSDLNDLLQAYYELYPLNRDKQVWFFFDEVQEVPNWEKFVRRVFDKENCRIYLTGSSSKLLSRELSTTLRGRTIPIEVFPLNFKEFLTFNEVAFSPGTPKGKAIAIHWFDRWMKQGGFPELVFLPQNLHRKTIDEYLDLMLYRDLTERFSIKNPSLLKYLLKYLVSNVANPFSVSKAFNDFKSRGYSLSRNTIYDYLSYLEEAFMVFKVEIWHRSVRTQAMRPGKTYIIDPALKYAMTIGEDRGRLLENAVFLHLRQQGHPIHYFLQKQEVDFFWENGTPTNVCMDMSSPQTRKRELSGMLEALEYLDKKEGLILTLDQFETIEVNGKLIRLIPAWQYFLGLEND